MTKKIKTEAELQKEVQKIRVVESVRNPQTGHFTLTLNGDPVPGTFSTLTDMKHAKARLEAGFKI
jgi:hypothetical protein